MTAGVFTIDSSSMIVPLKARDGVGLDSTYKNHVLDRLYHGSVGAVCVCGMPRFRYYPTMCKHKDMATGELCWLVIFNLKGMVCLFRLTKRSMIV